MKNLISGIALFLGVYFIFLIFSPSILERKPSATFQSSKQADDVATCAKRSFEVVKLESDKSRFWISRKDLIGFAVVERYDFIPISGGTNVEFRKAGRGQHFDLEKLKLCL